jgi:hypothetical protein
MSQYSLRIVVEKIDLKNNEKILSRETVTNIDIKSPDTIIDLGLRHGSQIDILQMIQEKLLTEQAPFLKPNINCCNDCQSKLVSNGYAKSKFHAVFTDHEIRVQKLKCLHCKKSVVPSVKSLLGTSIHPDLYRLQCEQGANHTYRKAERNMEQMCNKKRDVNNHNRIKHITNEIGGTLAEKNKVSEISFDIDEAKDLVVQVDGGHIKTTESNKRSIEVMCAKVYRPESIISVTEDRSKIESSSCAASAKYDKQSSMKKYVKTAATYQGLTSETQVTGLADGAKNCWGIIKSLEKSCKKLECILDWFHIAKKFEPAIKSARKETALLLKQSKTHLWSGDTENGLRLLNKLKVSLEPGNLKNKINGIYSYININKEYIVNYNLKAKNGKPYTSQVAESTVEHLINDRQKRNQKMQWSRTGAHNVLQIRASMASGRWEMEWQDAVFDSIKTAA